MFRQIFVNLAVKDMARSQAFFKALGLTFNQRFTNAQGACLEIGENFYAMLLVEPFFQGFTKKPISDAHKATEVILALSVGSRAEAEEAVRKAVAAGGSPGLVAARLKPSTMWHQQRVLACYIFNSCLCTFREGWRPIFYKSCWHSSTSTPQP